MAVRPTRAGQGGVLKTGCHKAESKARGCVAFTGLVFSETGAEVKAKKKWASYGCAKGFTARPHTIYPENAHCPECIERNWRKELKLVSDSANPG